MAEKVETVVSKPDGDQEVLLDKRMKETQQKNEPVMKRCEEVETDIKLANKREIAAPITSRRRSPKKGQKDRPYGRPYGVQWERRNNKFSAGRGIRLANMTQEQLKASDFDQKPGSLQKQSQPPRTQKKAYVYKTHYGPKRRSPTMDDLGKEKVGGMENNSDSLKTGNSSHPSKTKYGPKRRSPTMDDVENSKIQGQENKSSSSFNKYRPHSKKMYGPKRRSPTTDDLESRKSAGQENQPSSSNSGPVPHSAKKTYGPKRRSPTMEDLEKRTNEELEKLDLSQTESQSNWIKTDYGPKRRSPTSEVPIAEAPSFNSEDKETTEESWEVEPNTDDTCEVKSENAKETTEESWEVEPNSDDTFEVKSENAKEAVEESWEVEPNSDETCEVKSENKTEYDRQMAEDNLARQADEVEALSSIYEADWHVIDSIQRVYAVSIHENDMSLMLRVTLPEDYPTDAPPQYQISAPWLRGHHRQEIAASLEEIFVENLGENIIYLWVEQLREFLSRQGGEQELEDEPEDSGLGCDLEYETGDNVDWSSNFHTNYRSPSPKHNKETAEVELPEIFDGELFRDRKSVFQAHLAAVTSQEQAMAVLDKLKENKKIAAATHNIYAFRIIRTDPKRVMITGCEDDGETAAGSRLLHLLDIIGAENVMVIVTRWYGGIHLGPDRFKHISNLAREMLVQHGYVSNKTDKKGPQTKKKAK